MNSRYVISLILVGLVLTICSGCVDRSRDGGQESVPDTPQAPAGAATDVGGLTEDEMDSFESDLAELDDMLGGLDDIDAMGEVNDSTFA
ncbi:MAG: hypothetical protein U9Q68_01160 [Euryarchaeota archaeon]|nr:hypothetical protein [Euryarchaeota archaeon]